MTSYKYYLHTAQQIFSLKTEDVISILSQTLSRDSWGTKYEDQEKESDSLN